MSLRDYSEKRLNNLKEKSIFEKAIKEYNDFYGKDDNLIFVDENLVINNSYFDCYKEIATIYDRLMTVGEKVYNNNDDLRKLLKQNYMVTLRTGEECRISAKRLILEKEYLTWSIFFYDKELNSSNPSMDIMSIRNYEDIIIWERKDD